MNDVSFFNDLIQTEYLETLQIQLATLKYVCALRVIRSSSTVTLTQLKSAFSTAHALPVPLIKFHIFHIWCFFYSSEVTDTKIKAF